MNEKKYYEETIEKDTAYRKEYVLGIEAFLNAQKEKMEPARNAFISPKKIQGES